MTDKGCCTEWEQEIVLYLDGELSAESRKRVEKHFTRCKHCNDFYREVEREERLLAGALQQKSVIPVSSMQFADNVMAALPDIHQKTMADRVIEWSGSAYQMLFIQSRRHFALAASILICFMGIFATMQMGKVTEEPLIHLKRSGVLSSTVSKQPFYIIRPEGEYFQFQDNSIVYAAPETLFSVESYPENENKNNVGMERRIRLYSGEMFIDVQPRQEGFSVICPNSTVRVVGTQFHVKVNSGSTKITHVAVREGIVMLEAQGRSTRLQAGEMTKLWSIGEKVSMQSPEDMDRFTAQRLEAFNQSLADQSMLRLVPHRSLYDYDEYHTESELASPLYNNENFLLNSNPFH